MRCEGTTRSGEPCKAAAVTGGTLCYFHSLTPEEMVAMASKAGASPRQWELRLPRLETYEDAKEALSTLSEALANGRIPTDRGRAMLDVVRSWMDAHRLAREEATEAAHQARYEAARARQGASP